MTTRSSAAISLVGILAVNISDSHEGYRLFSTRISAYNHGKAFASFDPPATSPPTRFNPNPTPSDIVDLPTDFPELIGMVPSPLCLFYYLVRVLDAYSNDSFADKLAGDTNQACLRHHVGLSLSFTEPKTNTTDPAALAIPPV